MTKIHEVKQVIIIRKDLKMRRGKEISQGAHASMKPIIDILKDYLYSNISPQDIFPYEMCYWMENSFKKVTLQVNSEEELLTLAKKANAANLIVGLIQDEGLTEFGGVPTYTALAIGPNYSSEIDPITQHLSLY